MIAGAAVYPFEKTKQDAPVIASLTRFTVKQGGLGVGILYFGTFNCHSSQKGISLLNG